MLYTVSAVAELLCVDEETVRRWCRDGKLNALIDSKKKGWFITEYDLQEFVRDHPKYESRLYTHVEPPIDIDDMILSLADLIRQRDELNERINKIELLLKGGS